jgi:spore maturation protein A
MFMVMSWIWTGLLSISFLFAIRNGRGSLLAASVFEGAQAGVTLAISLCGSICLWSGAGKLMTRLGITESLSRLFQPVLSRLFPDTKTDRQLAGSLSANICANLLGLGNAATPMGIEAAKRLCSPDRKGYATDQLCRLIVLNTASIQLIPASVAAVRLSLGCASPFDILPAVWITSFSSAGLGLLAAALFGRVWNN